ncbi:MAG: hypothetical protein HPY82_13015 [Gammaproteobacteria bacterium]|nr:hypothetical protein [Gammaproteobacteria bacterium]
MKKQFITKKPGTTPLNQDFCDSPYQFMKKHVVVVTISDHFTKPNGNYHFGVKDFTHGIV